MTRRTRLVTFAVAALLVAGSSFAQTSGKRKVFLDQDGAGPAGTDTLSVLALLQSPDVEVLGVAITAGDVWVKEGVRNMLRMLELTGHEKVPVAPGGEQLLIDAVRQNPNEVTVWVGGPCTTVALALRLDPGIAALAKELVVMGAGFNVDKGGNHRINGRREFNWWWDPEATRIAMSAPWKKITITPVDISVKTTLGEDTKQRIARSQSKSARYVTKFTSRAGGYMWDEIAAVAWLDPTIITKQQELYVNVDIDHGASYGQTIFVEPAAERAPGQRPVPRKMASWWRVATVQWDLDVTRFYDQFADLMSR